MPLWFWEFQVCRYRRTTRHLPLALLFNTPASNSSNQMTPFQSTFTICLVSFLQNHFTPHTSIYPMHTPHYHKGSITTQRCHHSLIVLLALSMAAILHVPLHHIAIFHIGIERVSFHKTAFLPVTSIFNLFFVILGGKGL